MESFSSCLWRGGEKESRGERERERESAEEEKTKKNFRDKQLQRSLGGRGRSRRRPRKEKKWKSSLLFFTRESESCSPAGPRRARGLRGLPLFFFKNRVFPPRIHFSCPPPPESIYEEALKGRLSRSSSSLSLSSLTLVLCSTSVAAASRIASKLSFLARSQRLFSRPRENNNQD